ncbi:MAG: sugar ABC transporter permease, partial [Chloroflexota bacterium]
MPFPSKLRISERALSFLLLLPSLIVITIFVYGFIAFTFYVSLSNWSKVKIDLTPRQPLFQTYSSMFAMSRFQTDLRNTIVFTVLFMLLAILVGLLLAILLDRQLAGRL